MEKFDFEKYFLKILKIFLKNAKNSFSRKYFSYIKILLEPGPQGTRSSEADERREDQVDLPKVQLTQISILGVYPRVHITFSDGNIGAPRSNDPANERPCLSRDKNHFKNIDFESDICSICL